MTDREKTLKDQEQQRAAEYRRGVHRTYPVPDDDAPAAKEPSKPASDEADKPPARPARRTGTSDGR